MEMFCVHFRTNKIIYLSVLFVFCLKATSSASAAFLPVLVQHSVAGVSLKQ